MFGDDMKFGEGLPPQTMIRCYRRTDGTWHCTVDVWLNGSRYARPPDIRHTVEDGLLQNAFDGAVGVTENCCTARKNHEQNEQGGTVGARK